MAVSAWNRASLSCGLRMALIAVTHELHFRHEPPRKIERLTLLKSVHIFKKHRVQYEMRTLYRCLEVGFLQPHPKLFVSFHSAMKAVLREKQTSSHSFEWCELRKEEQGW